MPVKERDLKSRDSLTTCNRTQAHTLTVAQDTQAATVAQETTGNRCDMQLLRNKHQATAVHVAKRQPPLCSHQFSKTKRTQRMTILTLK